ncbi:MAG: dethiobiotin synthase [Hydrogenophilaceae bacterium]|nr:dethiobiotin synthase [Hydrogenophilaceae bacterium]
MAGIFVTGTDTGVGKTRAAVALLEALKAGGIRGVGMKPVAAGCEQVGGEWVNEDVARLRAASAVSAPNALINPYLLREPIAPHIAAERAGQRIELAPIVAACRDLERLADCVVVEGVGGFRVPLNEREDTADLAVALGLPVLLVVGLRLGCLNHALLSAEAIAARGLTLIGWIANSIDPVMPAHTENVRSLQERLAVPCLGEWPWLENTSALKTGNPLDLDPILSGIAGR